MESRIFKAQLSRLTRVTGSVVVPEFISEMYAKVKERYLEELKKRKIRLRELDGARLDEIVSYIFYYHIFHTSHLPPRSMRPESKSISRQNTNASRSPTSSGNSSLRLFDVPSGR